MFLFVFIKHGTKLGKSHRITTPFVTEMWKSVRNTTQMGGGTWYIALDFGRPILVSQKGQSSPEEQTSNSELLDPNLGEDIPESEFYASDLGHIFLGSELFA